MKVELKRIYNFYVVIKTEEFEVLQLLESGV